MFIETRDGSTKENVCPLFNCMINVNTAAHDALHLTVLSHKVRGVRTEHTEAVTWCGTYISRRVS